MSSLTNTRAHLVERAVEALGAGSASPKAPPVQRPVAPPPAPVEAPPPPCITLATLRDAGMITAPDGPNRSRVLEELAIVQHQVLRCIQDAPLTPRSRIVLITSALPHEGKTFIALNLAASIAASGARRVVLVDADGKAGGISHALGVANAPGLRHVPMDPAGRAAPPPVATALERLVFMPYGRAAGSEVPSGNTMATAILRLASIMPDHVIILDSPPSLSTSDSSALALVAGQVVLVVNAERTQRNEVEAALDMLEACPNLQLLLNRVRLTANDTFGAYGDYGVPDAV
ncbi:hypothetical protein C8P66_10870 [Humitalea rosea]|uniref:Capsular exopolysaccharide synthesis family protein n=1 Tax=Humitalea rosea TaxID=990373 RepID=A0A2W7IM01_9PROT|nr:hypothetical protein [Humitalea rosea]PZW46791.1 hypothetical protein C8P66_10870 [Humitalea rosea]